MSGETRFTKLDWIVSILGLVAWGLSLIGVVTNLFLGVAVLLLAFLLTAFEFWKWSKLRRMHLAFRMLVLLFVAAIGFWFARRQVVSQNNAEQPSLTASNASSSPESVPAVPSPTPPDNASKEPLKNRSTTDKKILHSGGESSLHLQRAQKLYAQGKHDEALVECNAALRSNPTNKQAIALRKQIVTTIDILEPSRRQK
jgi:hypothetical protein